MGYDYGLMIKVMVTCFFFLNDVFYFVKKSGICNYADDNIVTYSPLTLLKPKGYLHPKVKMSMSGSILTTCRLILENSRPFSWVKEDTVTVIVSQYKIIILNVKIQSNH